MAASLVDYHCHLDLYPDFENVIEECEKNQIYTLAVTTTPRAFPKNYELTVNKKYVRAALGLHPQLISSRADELEIWKEYFNKTRFIGEIGLDAGNKFYHSFELQKKVFKIILELCASSDGKVLSIHSIRSAPIVIDMLHNSGVMKKNKAVLHWFSGDAVNLKKAFDLGCYFSVNAEMLKNEKAKELIKQIPSHLLLTETDGPFTFIGKYPSRPKDVSVTIDLLSTLLNRTKDSTAELVLNNLMKIEE